MINLDNEILLTAEEFADRLNVGIKKSREIMRSDSDYVVTIGKRSYVVWSRFQKQLLMQTGGENNEDV